MKQFFPDKKGLITLRIFIMLGMILIIGAVRFFIAIRILVIVLSVLIALLAIFVVFIYLPLFFASIKYTVTDSEIIKSSGVFIKLHQSVRYSSIQYTTVVSSPFSQYTGLNFIIFFVYGGQLRLLFLKQSDALEILRISTGLDGEEV